MQQEDAASASGSARVPKIAALSMSGSSAVVAINALLLKRTKLAGIKRAGPPGEPSTAAKPDMGVPA